MDFNASPPDPRFSEDDITYIDRDGHPRLGVALRYHGHITYAIYFLDDFCYFTREGLASVYTSRHRAILRHFTQYQEERDATGQPVQHTPARAA